MTLVPGIYVPRAGGYLPISFWGNGERARQEVEEHCGGSSTFAVESGDRAGASNPLNRDG
jgi:hypothetical protein